MGSLRILKQAPVEAQEMLIKARVRQFFFTPYQGLSVC